MSHTLVLVMTVGETNQTSSMSLDTRLARTGYPRGWVRLCLTNEHTKAGFMDSFSSGIWPDYTTFPREKWAGTNSKSPEDLKDLECRIKCGSQAMDLMSYMCSKVSFYASRPIWRHI